MRTPLTLAIVASLLAVLVGCGPGFWDQKPDPRAYQRDRGPWVGN